MSRLTQGDVELSLGDETITLVCSPGAVQKISRQFGGIQAAMGRNAAVDVESMVAIVRYGANIEGAAVKGLADKLYRAGLLELTGPLSKYLLMLGNGGRDPDDAVAAESAEGNAG